uniref:Uncharacterized protein n=1 Tax=Leptobrachium leishanense TaxID=445787 RepID=A0A8C5LWX1_9ANUR
MVRGKGKVCTTKTPALRAARSTGPLDSFLHSTPPSTPAGMLDKMADGPSTPVHPPDSTEAIRRLEKLISALPTKSDLADIIADQKDGLGRVVRSEVEALSERVGLLEETARRPPPAAHHRPQTDLSELHRRVDDLDNRGRRHNIRIRGLSETDRAENLRTLLQEFFNMVLGRAPDSPVSIDRAHRALRPRPPPTAPPRDVICHLTEYSLKEAIMNSARSSRYWDFGTHRLELFQDLSPFTLAARRSLQPVTHALRMAKIKYRWGFPFALTAELNGVRHMICRPSDVPAFLTELNLPHVPIKNWELETRRMDPTGPLPRRQRSRRRQRRSRSRSSAPDLRLPRSPNRGDG